MISPYRIDIQQGNVVTQEMVAKLKAGQTRSQVRFVLGSPLVTDMFHNDRWDYIYLMQKQGKPDERRRLTVIFDGDKLVTLEGDIVLSDKALEPPPAPRAPSTITISSEPKPDPKAEAAKAEAAKAAAAKAEAAKAAAAKAEATKAEAAKAEAAKAEAAKAAKRRKRKQPRLKRKPPESGRSEEAEAAAKAEAAQRRMRPKRTRQRLLRAKAEAKKPEDVAAEAAPKPEAASSGGQGGSAHRQQRLRRKRANADSTTPRQARRMRRNPLRHSGCGSRSTRKKIRPRRACSVGCSIKSDFDQARAARRKTRANGVDMAKLKIAVAGSAGRMGRALLRSRARQRRCRAWAPHLKSRAARFSARMPASWSARHAACRSARTLKKALPVAAR